MKKLKAMLCGAAGMLLASIAYSPAMADASDFAGPYIAIQGSVNGSVVDGTATNSNAELTNGTLGNTFAGAGLQLGYSLPVGDTALIGIDLSYNPTDGKISIDAGAGDSGSDTEDITLSVGDVVTASIMPMISVTGNSAIYVKVGFTHADLTWTGDVVADLNSSMNSETYAMGIRSIFDNGAFIQTEFGMSDFDTMKVHKKTGNGTATASPELVYGAVSVGIRF